MKSNLIKAIQVSPFEIVEAIKYMCKLYPEINDLMIKELSIN